MGGSLSGLRSKRSYTIRKMLRLGEISSAENVNHVQRFNVSHEEAKQ
jgi:hypothetical protein